MYSRLQESGRVPSRKGFGLGESQVFEPETVHSHRFARPVKKLHTLAYDRNIVIYGKKQFHIYVPGVSPAPQCEDNLLPGRVFFVQGPPAAVPFHFRSHVPHLEILHYERLRKHFHGVRPFIFQITPLRLPAKASDIPFPAVNAHGTFHADSPYHALPEHAVDDIGRGKVRKNTESTGNHAVGDNDALPVRGTVNPGTGPLGIQQPVKRRPVRNVGLHDRKLHDLPFERLCGLLRVSNGDECDKRRYTGDAAP